MIRPFCLVFLALTGANAFVVPAPQVTSVSVPPTSHRLDTKQFSDSTGWDSFCNAADLDDLDDIAFGEAIRKYRRTVYSHDDWKKHRSPDRFFVYISAAIKDGVYKNLAREVIFNTGIAVFVCTYNAIFGGYTDLAGVEHAGLLVNSLLPPVLGLPLPPFTLASPSLGLLLVFRTNTSYKRWDEARKNWGMNINHTRDLVRMANTYYDRRGVSDEERQDDLKYVALCTWAFVRAMKRHLSPEEEDEQAFQKELFEKLPEQQAQMIIDAAHRPNRALQDLSYAIDQLPMHFTRKNEIHQAVTIFEDNLGSSERLLTSPVPLFYTRHTARFVAIWMFLLPFALYEPFKNTWNHIGMVPTTALLSIFLFGIEELATQLEEPFTLLPMQAFCDKIYNWCNEIMTWSPGDSGRSQKPVRPQHAYFGAVAAAAPQVVYQQQEQQPAPSEPQHMESHMESASAEVQEPPQQPPQQQPQASSQNLSFADFLKSQGQGQ